MKELSIEEKAQRYNKALEKARQLCAYPTTKPFISDLQDLFPELKESEDEKIRNFLIDFIKVCSWTEKKDQGWPLREKCIAWLEKQGEQKPIIIIPKFRVGDIIRHKEQRFTCKIIAVDTEYRLSGCNGTHLPFDSQDAYELVDQKPTENKGMNLVEEEMTPFQKKVFSIVDTTIEEEQGLSNICNELLALAIREIEQKPAWSEEDERLFQIVIDVLDKEKHKGHLSHTDLISCVRKLKSLKDRYTWKPSKEQIIALRWVLNNVPYNNHKEEISELLDQIKDL